MPSRNNDPTPTKQKGQLLPTDKLCVALFRRGRNILQLATLDCKLPVFQMCTFSGLHFFHLKKLYIAFIYFFTFTAASGITACLIPVDGITVSPVPLA